MSWRDDTSAQVRAQFKGFEIPSRAEGEQREMERQEKALADYRAQLGRTFEPKPVSRIY